MLVTLLVLSGVKSIDVKPEHPLNILEISVTLLKSMLPQFIVFNFEHSLKLKVVNLDFKCDKSIEITSSDNFWVEIEPPFNVVIAL